MKILHTEHRQERVWNFLIWLWHVIDKQFARIREWDRSYRDDVDHYIDFGHTTACTEYADSGYFSAYALRLPFGFVVECIDGGKSDRTFTLKRLFKETPNTPESPWTDDLPF